MPGKGFATLSHTKCFYSRFEEINSLPKFATYPSFFLVKKQVGRLVGELTLANDFKNTLCEIKLCTASVSCGRQRETSALNPELHALNHTP